MVASILPPKPFCLTLYIVYIPSLVVFNSEAIKTVYDCLPAVMVEELTDKQYTPNACTPLFDAIGIGITGLKKHISDEDVVLVTIVTDGLENASQEYNARSIGKMIESLKKKNWVFTYMGANQNVDEVGEILNIDSVLAFDNTVEETEKLFKEEAERHTRFSEVLSECTSPMELNYCMKSMNKAYFKREKNKNKA